jgi:hypothetical protein
MAMVVSSNWWTLYIVPHVFVCMVGSEVAKYSGEHLHHRIMDSDAFREDKVHDALKQGYLGIDDDLRAGKIHPPSFLYHTNISLYRPYHGTCSFRLHCRLCFDYQGR